MNKKAFEVEPELGVFYLVPNPKTMEYSIYSEFGDESLHLLLWDKIVSLLQIRFKTDVGDLYRGIPRGRIQKKDNGWLVSHGNDFPLEKYKDEIISEFKLREAEEAKLVTWQYSNHETMDSHQKQDVEKMLGIQMTKDGFKKVNEKKKKI